MTNRSEIERVLDRYLAEGAEQVQDRVIDAALDQVDHIPQRRALRGPWRFLEMPTFLKPALAGAAVLAVLVAGGLFLSRSSAPSVGGPGLGTASPSASPIPSPSVSAPLPDTADWVTFTSERYRYEMAHPPTWTAAPATRDWSLEADRSDWTGHGAADGFLGIYGGEEVLVTAFAADVPADMSADEWITAYYEPEEGAEPPPPECVPSSKAIEPISVDGHAGTLVVNDSCGDARAFVITDGRMHVFAVWRVDREALLGAFLSTVKFQE